MEKNRLHIRNRSGTDETDERTLRASGRLPQVDDTILLNGVVGVDRDLDTGYVHSLIIEEIRVAVGSDEH